MEITIRAGKKIVEKLPLDGKPPSQSEQYLLVEKPPWKERRAKIEEMTALADDDNEGALSFVEWVVDRCLVGWAGFFDSDGKAIEFSEELKWTIDPLEEVSGMIAEKVGFSPPGASELEALVEDEAKNSEASLSPTPPSESSPERNAETATSELKEEDASPPAEPQ